MENFEFFNNKNEKKEIPKALESFLNEIKEDFSSVPRKTHVIIESPIKISIKNISLALYFADVEGEYDQLRKILNSLISNAYHHQIDTTELLKWKEDIK